MPTLMRAIHPAHIALHRPCDPTTEADDPYRPFAVATRAIQLMVPSAEDDEIELPPFEHPQVPAARTIVHG
jgi:hypothetical protein